MPDLTKTLSPEEVNQQFLLQKCEYFVDVHLWPLKADLDPEGWLTNFLPAEMAYALQLLNSFVFYPDHLCNVLFGAAIQTLSRLKRTADEPFLASQASWQAFLRNALFTYVTGEYPNPTDSGYAFVRKARQVLGVDQDQIVHPDKALEVLVSKGPRPVIFVDDFVGSGNQFVDTWTRLTTLFRTTDVSFDSVSKVRGSEFYYCPLVCTQYGHRQISRDCPTVVLNPAHMLSDRYSALHPDSLVWPATLVGSAEDFIRTASARAGIPDTDGGEGDWRGFHKLGLTLAFAHSVPDATLPLIYWEQNGWTPLLRRT